MLYGMAINDAPYAVREKGQVCPFYRVWSHVVERAYSEKFKARNPAYRSTSMCEEWLRFSTFQAWMGAQWWQGLQLDKDIIGFDADLYSPDTCVFVPQALNALLTDRAAARGDLPLGVSQNPDGLYVARVHKGLGKGRKYVKSSKCPLTAHFAWVRAKAEVFQAVIDWYVLQPFHNDRAAAALILRKDLLLAAQSWQIEVESMEGLVNPVMQGKLLGK